MDNTSVTFEDLYSNYLSMIKTDKRFKNIGSATLIGMFLEMLAATSDMANFNLQRMSEEGFFRTAKLDSSYIKLCKNWGYAPRRAVPAQGELNIIFKGPFPKELKNLPENEKLTITLTNEQCNLSFLNMSFRLSDPIEYVFTKSDIEGCTNTSWSKRLRSVIIDSTTTETGPLTLTHDTINYGNRFPIKCYQGELKTIKFDGKDFITGLEKRKNSSNYSLVTDNNLGQRFDIDDISFSNWYGIRDPFAVNYRRKKNDSVYAPNNGLTKVYTRFKGEAGSKIFSIEDRSILLNESILTNFGANPPGDARPCICYVETNPDKTISVNFGPFSYLSQLAIEGKYDDATGTTEYPDLYVEYLSTRGAHGNKAGILESVLTNNAKLMLHTSIGVFDITNNIQFVFSGDLIGGENFEDKKEMYDNAEAYWTSQLKLVSKRDFINYFNSLSSPIDVITTLIFGLRELDNTFEVNQFKKKKEQVEDNTLDINLNFLFYVLASHMYINVGKGLYLPRNIFVKDSKEEWVNDGLVPESENMENPATLYYDEYNDHILDYIKCLVSQESFYNYYVLVQGEVEQTDPQYVKNIKEIAHNVNLLTPTNTAIMSLPPFFHYYDLVGSIEVDPGTTNLDDFKEKLNNKLYKYLDTLTLETREIYKSNLIKLCMEEDHVLNANLDLKVSNIIAPEFKQNQWNEEDQHKGVRVILNTEKLTSEYDKYKNWQNYKYDLIFNEIIIPKTNSKRKPYDLKNVTDESSIHIQFRIYNYQASGSVSNDEKDSTVDHVSKFTYEEFDNYIKIYLHTPYIGTQISLPPDFASNVLYRATTDYFTDPDQASSEIQEQLNADLIAHGESPTICRLYNIIARDSNNGFVTVTSYGNNYWSDSKYEISEARAKEYRLSLKELENLNADVLKWMKGLKIHDTADRAIDLPYNIKSFDVITRTETIMRRGDLKTSEDDTLSEKEFWNYLIKVILNKYYPNITESTDIYGNDWKAAERLIIDLYKLIKPGISDSILDDNNNVVNYSMDQDIAIIRCMFDVKYQSRI